jgi:hypothetical protein
LKQVEQLSELLLGTGLGTRITSGYFI